MFSSTSDGLDPLAMTAPVRSASETVSYSPSSPASDPSSPASFSPYASSPNSAYPPSSISSPPTPTSSSLSPTSCPSPFSSSSSSCSSFPSTPFTLFTAQRCPLCNFSSSHDPSLSHTCTRCGLTTPAPACCPFASPPPPTSHMQEAATAYRFHLLSGMTPLLSDLSSIVVSYLVWYRDPQSFHVGDRVDVMDVRGRWCGGEVREVEGEEVRVGLLGGSSKKWDQWIEMRSERLAPFGTKTKAESTKAHTWKGEMVGMEAGRETAGWVESR